MMRSAGGESPAASATNVAEGFAAASVGLDSLTESPGTRRSAGLYRISSISILGSEVHVGLRATPPVGTGPE